MTFSLDSGGYGFVFEGNDAGSGFDVNVGSIGVRLFTEATVDTDGKLTMTTQKSSTSTSADVAQFTRTTNGTAANGIGGKIKLGVENATGTQRFAELQFNLSDVTNSAEDNMFLLRGYRNGTLSDFLRIEGGDTNSILTTYYGIAQYNADYSVNYTDRSLVDKEYVVNAITTASTSGEVTKLATTINGDDVTTDFIISHNFETYDVMVQVFSTTAPRATVETTIERTNTNDITVIFNTAPASGTNFRILVNKIA